MKTKLTLTPPGRTLRPSPLLLLLAAAAVWLPRAEASNIASAASPPPTDRSEAPYFTVEGTQGERVDAFPLKSTRVSARLSGIIAEVEVTQLYANEAEAPLEAVYVFPGSTRAAVHGLEMRIGERLIRAEIQERDTARAGYEKARAERRQASLLEQERPNVFRMSVANIVPGAEVEVRLRYSEVLRPEERVYEWVFPAVVGPRYSRPDTKPGSWVANPYLREGAPTPARFSLDLSLRAGMKLQSLVCASHDADIRFLNEAAAELSLHEGVTADRDVVVRYQLAGNKVATGLLLDRREDESFFLLNVQPPARVPPERTLPREYVFIIDVSGSMNGFPLRSAQLLMADLLAGLRDQDRFNVLTFAAGSTLLSPESLPASPEKIARAQTLVRDQRGSGGTELLPALQRALSLPRAAEDMARCVVLVTDGYVDVEPAAFDLIREKLGEASFFTFGIGSSVNRHLLEGLARLGGGEPFVVLNEREARAQAGRFLTYIAAPVLTRVRVDFEGFDASDIQPATPTNAYADRPYPDLPGLATASVTPPDVYADRPVLLTGKWRGEPRGRIRVTGLAAGRPYEAWIDVAAEAAKPGALSNPALRPLWAREKTRELADYAGLSEREKNRTRAEVTALGLKYHLLTEFTSFLAADASAPPVLPNAAGQLASVRQPLPLPHGVSQSAANPAAISITGNAGSTPEPGLTSLLLLSLAALWLQRRRPR